MLSATPPKTNRRSTRAGRYSSGRRGGGGGDDQPSWRPSKEAARKWIQVKRPPAAGARFFIPTWVPLDELTPEEKVKYANQLVEETPDPSGTGDADMTDADASKGGIKSEQIVRVEVKESVVSVPTESSNTALNNLAVSVDENTKEIVKPEQAPPMDAPEEPSTASTEISESIHTEMKTGGEPKVEVAMESKTVIADTSTDAEASKPAAMDAFELLVNTASNAQAASVPANARIEMADADSKKEDEQPLDTAEPSEAPNTQQGDSKSKSTPTELSPLNLSRETSEGVPGFVADSKASKSWDEGERPHNPVADILQDPASVAPPSRPVSEPSAMLMEGPATPLFGESVMHPVPVAVQAKDDSPTEAPTAARTDSVHFAHSESDTTPFHAPLSSGSKDENESKEEPAGTDTPNASDEQALEPERKRPRLEF